MSKIESFSVINNNVENKALKRNISSKTSFGSQNDSVNISKTVDKSNDGKFSISEAAKNLVKGVFSPITYMFQSPKNFLAGVAMMAASSLLMVATAGTITPVLVGFGVAMGSFQLGKGIFNLITSKNGDEAEKSFYDVGLGSSSLGLSVLGAKSSLKQSNISVKNLDPNHSSYLVKEMTPIKAVIENIKQIPESLSVSFKSLKDKTAFTRLTNFFTRKKPSVVVVDDHKTKQIDIDGDRVSDFTHGEIVKKTIESTYPKAKTSVINIADDKGVIPLKEIARAFVKINRSLKKGESIDAVNLSIGNNLDINLLAKATGKPITRGNILDYKNEIRSFIQKMASSSEESSKIFKPIDLTLRAIERVTKKGVKVYISGGNEGSGYINTFNLADGTINVGATNSIGKKMLYSADNQAIQRYTQGTFTVTPIEKNNIFKGYDLTGSGKVEIPANNISGGSNIVKSIEGKSLEEVLLPKNSLKKLDALMQAIKKRSEAAKKAATQKPSANKQPAPPLNVKGKSSDALKRTIKKRIEAIKKEASQKPSAKKPSESPLIINNYISSENFNKLISVDDYIQFLKKSGSELSLHEIEKIKSSGKYVDWLSTVLGKTKYFDVVDNKIVYNPDCSGRAAVNVINGTSFSSPRALGLDLNKDFASLNTVKNYFINTAESNLNIANSKQLIKRKDR